MELKKTNLNKKVKILQKNSKGEKWHLVKNGYQVIVDALNYVENYGGDKFSKDECDIIRSHRVDLQHNHNCFFEEE
jgi:hypothetical protein